MVRGILSRVTERSRVRWVAGGNQVERIASWGCYFIFMPLGEVFLRSASTKLN